MPRALVEHRTLIDADVAAIADAVAARLVPLASASTRRRGSRVGLLAAVAAVVDD
jgi:hypothetical protein